MSAKEIEEFWHWFASAARHLADDPTNAALLHALDTRVNRLNPEVTWEIGPGRSVPWAFVISPNLRPELRSQAAAIVARAPTLDGWEFLPARPHKDWTYSFEIERDTGAFLKIDASSWTFVLLHYPDLTHELLLCGSVSEQLTDHERWQVATVVLEGALGEEKLIDLGGRYELVDELDGRFIEKQRPIQQLWDAFLPKTASFDLNSMGE